MPLVGWVTPTTLSGSPSASVTWSSGVIVCAPLPVGVVTVGVLTTTGGLGGSAGVTAAAVTVTVTVPVTVSGGTDPALSEYVNVSTPVYPAAGVYVTVPAALSTA